MNTVYTSIYVCMYVYEVLYKVSEESDNEEKRHYLAIYTFVVIPFGVYKPISQCSCLLLITWRLFLCIGLFVMCIYLTVATKNSFTK